MDTKETNKLPETEEEVKKLLERRAREEQAVQRPNRATRRRKPLKPRYNMLDYIVVPNNILTKPSHKYKKLRSQNAIETRKEKSFRTRKDSQKDNTQVS